MVICHISDTHNRHNKIKIPECDVLVCSGDISGTGEKHEVMNFFKWFMKQTQATYRVLTAGNHDISFDASKDLQDNEKPLWLQEQLQEYKYLDSLNHYLENEGCEIEGVKFWGSPVTPRFGSPRWAFNKDRGWDIREVWNNMPEGTDVSITHGPPAGVLDLVPDYTTLSGFFRGGGHQGCVDLIDRIKWVKPKVCLFGHIHEGYGEYVDDEGIRYFNGSIVNMQYEPVNKPHIFEL